MFFSHRKIYWTEWGNQSKIESADLDGENRVVLVDKGLQWPNGIALDYLGRKLYWANAKYKAVESYDLITKEVARIYSGTIHPFGITVLDDYVYWTDWFRKVQRFHVETKKIDVVSLFIYVTDCKSSKHFGLYL